MNTFPLVRVKWSNEHWMAALFFVLVLYHLPRWVLSPSDIVSFIIITVAALVLDAAVNFIRYKRPICAVSAAVTAAMLHALTYGVPLWGQLLGVTAGLLIGKHIWGGTGKNIFNPSATGLLLIVLIFDVSFSFFAISPLLIPALLLSLPFLSFRPYAGIGFMVGMAIALLVSQGLNMENIIAYGVIFWGCLVLTDPVTVTIRPVAAFLVSFIAGFAALNYYPSAMAMALAVLSVNLISHALGGIAFKVSARGKPHLKIQKIIPVNKRIAQMIDLTGDSKYTSSKEEDISIEEITKRIKYNEVFGFGGAAFSTYQKIMTAVESGARNKHLIINGVECDPGLIHDQWLLRNYPNEIYRGIEIICKCVKFASVTLAVKDTEGLKYPKSLKICKVPDCYPAGAEKVLISHVLKKQLAYDMIPASYGILVLNVHTIYSIYEAVCRNKRADSRFLTAANLRGKSAGVVKVKLGTKIKDVIDAVYPTSNLVFAGGGAMQCRTADEEDIVDKTVNYIAAAELPSYKESPLCTKCGTCMKNCPAGLEVYRIAELVDKGNISGTKKYHAHKCIGCGSCSYSCLAGRNLSARVKTAKEG